MGPDSFQPKQPIRYPDWPARLTKFLLSRHAEPFRYGTHDCCLFVADAVHAMTGEDLAENFRGRYRSRVEALALVGTPEAVLAGEAIRRGLLEIPPVRAGRGDVAILGGKRHSTLGLLSLNGHEILAAGRRGFLRLPRSRAARAWRI